ncbi:MAG: carbon storage regulator [Hungatella sp.]|jgi:carbon storage regulator|uniref:carbon storage regulator n=1 Tax=Clostridium sp. NkU-1 TaxID=1095009 RepID=UPI0006CF8E25|nr:carbon storage regulator [Hungatella sp.]MDR1547868.1 carbon storage regulator [Hungatella sp.]MDR1772562.1 carbon storage regulator [Hungatella sp.]MDR2024646.1 carbon storage regulator [Hungatella sp.]
MLSLGRNPGEYLVINGDIVIQVVSVEGDLRLAIDAPKDISIVRGEIYEKRHPMPQCLKRLKEKSMRW